MRQQHFATPGKVELRVDNKAGPVSVRAHAGTTTEVELASDAPRGEEAVEQARVEHQGFPGRHRVVVVIPPERRGLLQSVLNGTAAVAVTVKLPEGSDIEILTATGDISAVGRFGEANIESASGDVTLEQLEGQLNARTATGDVQVRSVMGETKVTTASGDVRIGYAGGEGRVKTASGGVVVDQAEGPLTVHTASGDVTVREMRAGGHMQTASGDQRIERLVSGNARMGTVSGDLRIGVARGTVVAVDASTVTGDLSSEIELGADEPGPGGGEPRVDLYARSVSGDLHIQRAPA